jgi:hypothetical protein
MLEFPSLIFSDSLLTLTLSLTSPSLVLAPAGPSLGKNGAGYTASQRACQAHASDT